MSKDPVDRLQLVFIVVVAVAAIAVAIICAQIVDRSYEHVKEIKETKIEGTTDDISMDIIKNSADAKNLIDKARDTREEARFYDDTITKESIEKLYERPDLTRLKILRCDYDSSVFEAVKKLKLKAVSMSDVPVDKKMLDAFLEIPTLTQIEMFRCNLEPTSLDNLAVSKVRLVKFRKCGEGQNRVFTAELFKDMARSPILEHAELSKSHFEPGAMEGLKDSHLAVLNVSQTNLSDSDLNVIKDMPELQYLDIDNCPGVTCVGLKAVLKAPKLKQAGTSVVVSSCELPLQQAAKFQRSLFRIPKELQFNSN